jgi:hypothetical protein
MKADSSTRAHQKKPHNSITINPGSFELADVNMLRNTHKNAFTSQNAWLHGRLDPRDRKSKDGALQWTTFPTACATKETRMTT